MGVAVVRDTSSYVISVYPGAGTNQVAELLALRVAIEVANPGDRIFSDSQYAINISLSRWQAKMHLEIVRDIRIALSLKRVSIEWIRRCSHPLHALADFWANNAAMKREPRIELNGCGPGMPETADLFAQPSNCVRGDRPVIEPRADSLGAWVARVAAEAMRDPPDCDGGSAEQKLTEDSRPVGSRGTCEVQGVSRFAKAGRGVIRRRPRIVKLD